MEYQLELKQIVDFPRCRIYRDFIRKLSEDKNIRVNGSSNLYYYIVLCSYANFRTSTHGIEGITYTVYPGEWICRANELKKWFRCRFQWQAMKILEHLQKMNLITITKYDRKSLIKFKIVDWKKSNKILEYNYPCQKDDGFFFFPISIVSELIGNEKCSEMDIILDLWINAIYNDEQVQGSDVGAVVYYRNCTGSPVISYADLALRWSISKSSVARVLKKFERLVYITLVTFQGRQGTAIYITNYLSVMFDISDIAIDKDEVSMALKMNVVIDDSEDCNKQKVNVSYSKISVPKPHIEKIVSKVAEVLSNQGISCFLCSKSTYILSKLSDCDKVYFKYILTIECPNTGDKYEFLINIKRSDKLEEVKCDGKNKEKG